MDTMISVDKEMPEDGAHVLGWADEWGYFLGWREGKYWKRGIYKVEGSYIALVTHWAELPKLPEE